MSPKSKDVFRKKEKVTSKDSIKKKDMTPVLIETGTFESDSSLQIKF